ncbi:hypothetical protein RMSM_03128 [Rhodopirellula maiorica SM1]|uniref:Uncharacterized protein n=1 Tax=Rhodopirellula maiorica SM1 TaxID=1265738 RepID=M5RX10_9BACT|nr:hypothetical protein RMSM_03128 [Rhodopirellula maiorica SM1]
MLTLKIQNNASELLMSELQSHGCLCNPAGGASDFERIEASCFQSIDD